MDTTRVTDGNGTRRAAHVLGMLVVAIGAVPYGAPPVTIGPAYTAKTIPLCAADDTICSGGTAGPPNISHAMYPLNGMVGQAADFAASRL